MISQQTEQPVTHRVFAGTFKHHYLLKTGRMAHQKTPLNPKGGKQLLGYQLLVDETRGAAFVDIYQVREEGRPRLPLVCAFLAIGWLAPAQHAEGRRSIGLPDVLFASKKDLTATDLRNLLKISSELGFSVQHPESGFAGGIHYVKALGSALDHCLWNEVDWTVGVNLNLLSHVAAAEVAHSAKYSQSGFFREYFQGPRTRHREVPAAWAEKVAKLYGQDSVKDLTGYSPRFFAEPQPRMHQTAPASPA